MKKAKIMLMAIAVVVLVGGALAFKVAKFTDPNLYSCRTTTATSTAKFCLATAANSTTGMGFVDPVLVFTTVTSFHAGTPDCTTTIGGVAYGCYDHPVRAFINQ